MPEPTIFISYSHADRVWADRIFVHLKPALKYQEITAWIDISNLAGGQEWQHEISNAISSAEVFLLLVSPSYLGSAYITEQELPQIIELARQRGKKILWIALRTTPIVGTPLADIQALNDPMKPLDTLSEAELSKALVSIARNLLEAINPSLSSEALTGIEKQVSHVEVVEGSQDDINEKLVKLENTVDRLFEQSKYLTARVVLPPQETMDVKLVPSNSFDRLEEYNSDINIAYLLIGTFTGAILGILSNWATDENFNITRFSIILIVILAILFLGTTVWAVNLRMRSNKIKSSIINAKD